jgi:hypothetical protein
MIAQTLRESYNGDKHCSTTVPILVAFMIPHCNYPPTWCHCAGSCSSFGIESYATIESTLDRYYVGSPDLLQKTQEMQCTDLAKRHWSLQWPTMTVAMLFSVTHTLSGFRQQCTSHACSHHVHLCQRICLWHDTTCCAQKAISYTVICLREASVRHSRGHQILPCE